jgi:oxalate decarboxylase/phosphoglucose isomerase-like protein (cupin superfamily)
MPKDAPETIYLQPWNDWTIDRTIYRKIPVKEGDIVIIPKFIKHFTEPNKSKKIKKVISWDMQLYDF